MIWLDEPARLTEQELLARMRRVEFPNPVVVVGPAYPITSFADYDNPYPGYYYGAKVVVNDGLTDLVQVQETAPTK